MMTATIADITLAMEIIAPSCLAEEWDSIGLQVGRDDWPVQTIWVALDPLRPIVAAACTAGVDLLITHHPLIFTPLTSVDFNTNVGAIIQMASQNNLAIFCAHTNLDASRGGINEILATRIGLKNLESLDSEAENGSGIGRIGDLDGGTDLLSFAKSVKENLHLNSINMAGAPDLPVERAAVCSGSGSGMLNLFLSSGAQVFVSGDLKYHDARTVEGANLGLIDIGHFASEHLIVESVAERLDQILAGSGFNVKVEAYRLETDPFSTL
ncbi:MAG: Nif3-like dinuclear metal center hexameric protein [Desulfobacterales bacterium]|nr:Nif3-like dinuclear metal center hexameric protein [Desulfobacterales bacterium]